MTVSVALGVAGGTVSSGTGAIYAADYGFSTSNTAAQNHNALVNAREAASLIAAAVSQAVGIVVVGEGTFRLSATSMVANNGYAVAFRGQGKNITFLGPMADSGAGTALLDFGTATNVLRSILAEGFTLYGPAAVEVLGTIEANCDGIRLPPGASAHHVRVDRCNAGFVLIDDHHTMFDCQAGSNYYGVGLASNGNLGNCTHICCDYTSNNLASVACLAAGGSRGYKSYGTIGGGDYWSQVHLGFAPVAFYKESTSVTATTNGTTAVTGISPALPVGSVHKVISASASDIAVGNTLTVTGTGTTGTLSATATGSHTGETLVLGDPNGSFASTTEFSALAIESVGNAVWMAPAGEGIGGNTFNQSGLALVPNSDFTYAGLPSDYAVLRNTGFRWNTCTNAEWLFQGSGSSGSIHAPGGFTGNTLIFGTALPTTPKISQSTPLAAGVGVLNRIFTADGARGRFAVAAGAISQYQLVQYDPTTPGEYSVWTHGSSSSVAGVALTAANGAGDIFYLANGGAVQVQASAALSGATQQVIPSTTADGQVQAAGTPSGGVVTGSIGVAFNDEGGTPRLWKVFLRSSE